MNPELLTSSLKSEARRLGFELAGACPAVNASGIDHLAKWIEVGMAGEMQYFKRRQSAYAHPSNVMPGSVSILMLGMNYLSGNTQPLANGQEPPGTGRVSCYAWGSLDYHELIHSRLRSLEFFLRQLIPDAKSRAVVDTAPLLEREFAQLAGLGWPAKNTLLINRRLGSWFFLAALLLDQPLKYDQPHWTDHCGTCTACLDACPTRAFAGPHTLDATKCISYLTIEHRSAIAKDLRPLMGDWLFGCDICQQVCPWNRRAAVSSETAFQPADGHGRIELRSLFSLTDAQFRSRFRDTPLWRPRRRGILRNAAIVLGNQPSADSIPALRIGLNDSEELVRGACAWALGRHRLIESWQALSERMKIEQCNGVIDEIQDSLEALGSLKDIAQG